MGKPHVAKATHRRDERTLILQKLWCTRRISAMPACHVMECMFYGRQRKLCLYFSNSFSGELVTTRTHAHSAFLAVSIATVHTYWGSNSAQSLANDGLRRRASYDANTSICHAMCITGWSRFRSNNMLLRGNSDSGTAIMPKNFNRMLCCVRARIRVPFSIIKYPISCMRSSSLAVIIAMLLT